MFHGRCALLSRLSERKCRGKRIKKLSDIFIASPEVSLKGNYLVHKMEMKWGKHFCAKVQETIILLSGILSSRCIIFCYFQLSSSLFMQMSSALCALYCRTYRTYRGTIRAFNNSYLRGVKIEGHILL